MPARGAQDTSQQSQAVSGYATAAESTTEATATTTTTEAAPEVHKPETRLPPGWRAVWNEAEELYYYADVESQASQWDAPPAYEHIDWKRRNDPEEYAFWVSRALNISFYEEDEKWQRLVDHKGQIYWSNREMQIRFFEVNP